MEFTIANYHCLLGGALHLPQKKTKKKRTGQETEEEKGKLCVCLLDIVNKGKPLSLSEQMKLNGKENYIMLVSMGRHNIIFSARVPFPLRAGERESEKVVGAGGR